MNCWDHSSQLRLIPYLHHTEGEKRTHPRFADCCWDISGVEGVSQCYFYCGFLLLWVKVACGSVSEFIVVSYLIIAIKWQIFKNSFL